MIKNRIELAKHFKDLGFKMGAEIGVADGRYSEILCKTIPNLKLYAIDPWAKYDGNWRSDKYQDKAFEKAKKRLKKYKALLVRSTGVHAYANITNPKPFLDFVFIDGAHDYDNVMLDIILWSRKVRKGGIVAGHDYYKFKSGNVIEAVNDYAKIHKVKVNLTQANSAEHKDDQCPCWWFVKK